MTRYINGELVVAGIFHSCGRKRLILVNTMLLFCRFRQLSVRHMCSMHRYGAYEMMVVALRFVAFMNLELLLYVGLVLVKLPKLCKLQAMETFTSKPGF